MAIQAWRAGTGAFSVARGWAGRLVHALSTSGAHAGAAYSSAAQELIRCPSLSSQITPHQVKTRLFSTLLSSYDPASSSPSLKPSFFYCHQHSLTVAVAPFTSAPKSSFSTAVAFNGEVQQRFNVGSATIGDLQRATATSEPEGAMTTVVRRMHAGTRTSSGAHPFDKEKMLELLRHVPMPVVVVTAAAAEEGSATSASAAAADKDLVLRGITCSSFCRYPGTSACCRIIRRSTL